jgi:hypothetical protein
VGVNGCCILNLTVVGWRGAGLLGRAFWGRFFYDGLLWTDLVRLSLVGGRRLETVLNGSRKQVRRT